MRQAPRSTRSHDRTRDRSGDADGIGRLSRRDVLRWAGAVGAAAVAPVALGACEPAATAGPLVPDPSLRSLGFLHDADVVVGQGGWCWFQSPRASFGPGGLLWLGSSVAHTGTDDDGAVQLLALDVRTGTLRVRRTLARTRQDDHTSPSVLALGDGVQVAWSLHQNVDYLEVGDTSANGVLVVRRVRRPESLTPPGRGMAYASAHVVGGQRWLLYRGEQFSWNLLTSPDGVTWTARGLVVAPRASGDRPYLHAASDGARLHLAVTDGNPTEFRGNSVYVGRIDADLTVRRGDGVAVGAVGSGAPKPSALTRLGTGVAGATEAQDTDWWLSDLVVVDGRPTGVLVQRDPWPAGSQAVGGYRHRYHWIRQRPSGWTIEPLCWAGGELCPSQPDYAALAAQDPTDPTRVVVATDVHPVTGEPLLSAADGQVHSELFEARRVGEGSWAFTAITADSTEDNMRPVIAAGGTDKALAWLRGTYWSWTDFDTRIIVRRAVAPSP